MSGSGSLRALDFAARRSRIHSSKRQGPVISALVPAAERSAASDRRLLHHDEAGPLEVLDKALCDDLGHDLIGVVHSLPPLEPESERQGIG